MKRIIVLLFILPLMAFAQETTDLFGIHFGYGSTNIIFKEAEERSLNVFGADFSLGNNYSGSGVSAGISKNITDRVFIDLSYSAFSGKDVKARINNFVISYTMKGYVLPLTANYLIRNASKRVRYNVGIGLQYLKADMRQLESITADNGQTSSSTIDIKTSELQLAFRPGIQFRIVPQLFAGFIVRVGISANGRYSDNPSISLKYNFQKTN